MNYQKIIEDLYSEIKKQENIGNVASYIPELAKVDPDKFAISLSSLDHNQISVGDAEEKFSIQSIAKVFALSLAYRNADSDLWKRVGVEPSGTPFNSLVQLESDQGIPRNPFINAGAIVICDILQSQLKDPKVELLHFIRMVANNPNLEYCSSIAESEKSEGFRNVALINFIKSFGNINNGIDEVLDLYFNLCSIRMSCNELSSSFLYLANHGIEPAKGKMILNSSQCKRMNAIMQSCGFYDEAGEFAFKVGLPGKSGVGGGIIAVHPNKYCIAVWSPKLNSKGNSYRGVKFLELFTTRTKLSIF